MDQIVVTTSREGARRAETPSSVTVLEDALIERVHPGHPAEILGRVPGVAVQQTNGEGHLTGIRQPIGTSPLYLFLEDGVPVRASGFFNHNALYEVNLPQSGGMEVIRGPGTALQGSDAIGGVVNVLTRAPAEERETELLFEAGDYGWVRALVSASDTWGDLGARADLNVTRSDGWRDRSGYDRQTLTLRADRALANGSHLKAVVALTNIDQDTGANSFVSASDYRERPTRNYTPFAFREVRSARASLDWQMELGQGRLLSVTPYLRWSEMELLPTFTLRFDPQISTSGYASAGALLKYRQDFAPGRTRLITGLDLDYSPGWREEDRIWATTDGPVFVSYTTQGRMYDYDVTFWQTSPYVQLETSPIERLRLTAGLRLDVLGFDYENNLADGAFQAPIGPAPNQQRTFFRPPDRSLDYERLSPSAGLTWAFTPGLNGFLSYKQSFRVPQETNLFRQGANRESTSLDPVKADSLEAGLRGTHGARLSWELVAYRMHKDDDILTFNDGSGPTQTNNGRTLHEGIEAALGWVFLRDWRLDLAVTHAEHEYRQWVTSSSASAPLDFSGRTISSAPQHLVNATLSYSPRRLEGLDIEAEWVRLGSYWMDDANTTKYGGHDLVNLRVRYETRGGTEFFVRATNLFDTRWATAAQVQLVGGEPQAQYAPGTPFSLYGGIRRRFR